MRGMIQSSSRVQSKPMPEVEVLAIQVVGLVVGTWDLGLGDYT